MLDIKWIGCAVGNYAVGRAGYKPDSIVIHLMDGTLSGTDSWFLTPPEKRGPNGAASSAHYGIGQDGSIHQYVKDEDRAYHAGRVSGHTWSGIDAHTGVNPNNFTLGIEHEGKTDTVWSEAMLQASAALIRSLSDTYLIPLDRAHICGHHEIYDQKTCPGPNCDLDKLIAMAAALAPNIAPTS